MGIFGENFEIIFYFGALHVGTLYLGFWGEESIAQVILAHWIILMLLQCGTENTWYNYIAVTILIVITQKSS